MKRSPIPKHLQGEVAAYAHAAYMYVMERTHPLPDSIMIAHDWDILSQLDRGLSYEARVYIKGHQHG